MPKTQGLICSGRVQQIDRPEMEMIQIVPVHALGYLDSRFHYRLPKYVIVQVNRFVGRIPFTVEGFTLPSLQLTVSKDKANVYQTFLRAREPSAQIEVLRASACIVKGQSAKPLAGEAL